MERTSGADTGVILSDPSRRQQSLPFLAPRTFRNPGLPIRPPQAQSSLPGARGLSYRLVGTQTPGTRGRTCPCDPRSNADKSHSPWLARKQPNFTRKPHRHCLRPALTFTRARGSDVKATRSALAQRLGRPPIPEVGASLASSPAETRLLPPAPPPRPEAGTRLRLAFQGFLNASGQ